MVFAPPFFRFDPSELPLHFWCASLKWANEKTIETHGKGHEAATGSEST